MSPRISAAVLTGGQSLRMGRDKAFVIHPLDGRPFWMRQVSVLRALGPEQVFLSHHATQKFPGCPDVVFVADSTSGQGPLGGIASVLAVCQSPLLVVLAVDLAAMIPAPLRFLLDQSRPGCGAVFEASKSTEPLAAVYPKEALPLALTQLRVGRLAVREWVAGCREAGHLALFRLPELWKPAFQNVNRPADLAALAASPS